MGIMSDIILYNVLDIMLQLWRARAHFLWDRVITGRLGPLFALCEWTGFTLL
jgi:hypothetical protein